jgi:hypothetical protein
MFSRGWGFRSPVAWGGVPSPQTNLHTALSSDEAGDRYHTQTEYKQAYTSPQKF